MQQRRAVSIGTVSRQVSTVAKDAVVTESRISECVVFDCRLTRDNAAHDATARVKGLNDLGLDRETRGIDFQGNPIMFGFKPASQLDPFTSGMVRGPGTATSDSVKDTVPPGTFIMPADSTRQIGAEQLAGMGFRPGMRPPEKPAPNLPLGFRPKGKAGGVPVNLSNGEFKLSPEQVHAIGAQVLDGIKSATHTPTGETPDHEAGEMEGDHVSRPALNFADGGLVDTPKRDPFAYQAPGTAPASTQPSPIPGAERPAQPTFKPDASAPSPVKGPLDSMGTAFGETAKKLTFGGFDSRASDIQAQNRAGLTAEPEKPQTTNPGLSGAFSASSTPAASPAPSAPVGAATSVPGVRRIDEPGKSPLFTNVGADGQSGTTPQPAAPISPGTGLGFRPGMGGGSGVGAPDVMGILQRESQIRAGMGALQDQINFNGGGYGFRKTTPDEAVREMLVNGNSRDRAAALDFVEGREDANDRTGLAQQDHDKRQLDAQSRQGVAAGDLAMRQETHGLQAAALGRIGALQDQFMAEPDPEKRSAIAQQLRELSGKDLVKPDAGLAAARTNLISKLGEQYAAMSQMAGENKKMPSFEAWAAPYLRAAGMGGPDPRQQEGATLRGRGGKMYQVRNGVPVLVDAAVASGAPSVPAVGAVINGNRFRGGNPNDRNSWEKV